MLVADASRRFLFEKRKPSVGRFGGGQETRAEHRPVPKIAVS